MNDERNAAGTARRSHWGLELLGAVAVAVGVGVLSWGAVVLSGVDF